MTFRESPQNFAQRAVMRVVAGIEKWESGVGFNPLDPRQLDNPYPFYHELREKDPVHRSKVGPWIISRYADALEVFQDKRLSSDLRNSTLWPTMHKLRLKSGRTQEEIDNPEMLHSDPPRHTRLRGLVNQAFTPAAISAFAPRVEQIISGMQPKGGDTWQGHIYNADDGKVYSASLELQSHTRAKVEGCVLSVLCRSQTWIRAN